MNSRTLIVTLSALVLTLSSCTITIGNPRVQVTPSAAPTLAAPSTTPTPTVDANSTAAPGSSAGPTSTAPPSAGPPASSGWAGLVKTLRDGVVRIQVAGCDSGLSWMGSGFAVADHLIVTAAHVARDAETISVKSDTGIAKAEVIAYDLSTDTALLHTDRSFKHHTLKISKKPLDEGADLAVLGYPLGVNDLRISNGIVSGLDDKVSYPDQNGEAGFSVKHVFVTNAATNGGNSGGPVIDNSGEVIGLVSGGQIWDESSTNPVPVQGTNYIVPATSILDRYDAWKDQEVTGSHSCGTTEDPPTDNNVVLNVTVDSSQADAGDIAQALFLHGQGISTGDYQSAWAVFTPRMQRRLGHEHGWAKGLATSYWTDLTVERVTRHGHIAKALTYFRTRQDAANGHNGQTCSDWVMTYTMKLVNGVWLIDGHKGAAGSPTAC